MRYKKNFKRRFIKRLLITSMFTTIPAGCSFLPLISGGLSVSPSPENVTAQQNISPVPTEFRPSEPTPEPTTSTDHTLSNKYDYTQRCELNLGSRWITAFKLDVPTACKCITDAIPYKAILDTNEGRQDSSDSQAIRSTELDCVDRQAIAHGFPPIDPHEWDF
jgi:hypothetical protein